MRPRESAAPQTLTSSVSPGVDVATPRSPALSQAAATPPRVPPAVTPEQVWAATASLLAGGGRVRLGTVRRSGVEYRGRDERPLTQRLPGRPAAVRIYGDDGTCTALFLDLDSSRSGAETVEREARSLTKWLVECGARVIEDVSPNGGRHIYVPLADRLEQASARELVEALALRFPIIDASPHRSARSGCIRTPGSRHASGGHQELVTPLASAVDVLRRRNPADVVTALHVRLAPQIAAWRATQTPERVPAPVEVAQGSVEDRGGTKGRSLSPRITRIAREGIYDTARYASPSEARMAVLAAAARANWKLTDVVVRLEDGRWPGLAGLYAAKIRGHEPRRRRISQDWRKACDHVARTTRQNNVPGEGGTANVLRSNTSLPESQGGTPQRLVQPVADPDDEHSFIRTWTTAFLSLEQHRIAGYGVKVRWLGRALAEAAHKSGNRHFAFGVRSLAVATGCDHTTVAAMLKVLTQLGWIDRIEAAQGTNADLYSLTLPHDLVGHVETLRWHPGRVHAMRPAFRELGDVAGLVFESLELDKARSITELVTATGFSRSAVADAVDVLVAVGAAERGADGLVPHPERLPRIAEDLGTLDAVGQQLRTYARHRREWHAYLARHDRDAHLTAADLYDPLDDEYWLPPPEGVPGWSILEPAA